MKLVPHVYQVANLYQELSKYMNDDTFISDWEAQIFLSNENKFYVVKKQLSPKILGVYNVTPEGIKEAAAMINLVFG